MQPRSSRRFATARMPSWGLTVRLPLAAVGRALLPSLGWDQASESTGRGHGDARNPRRAARRTIPTAVMAAARRRLGRLRANARGHAARGIAAGPGKATRKGMVTRKGAATRTRTRAGLEMGPRCVSESFSESRVGPGDPGMDPLQRAAAGRTREFQVVGRRTPPPRRAAERSPDSQRTHRTAPGGRCSGAGCCAWQGTVDKPSSVSVCSERHRTHTQWKSVW